MAAPHVSLYITVEKKKFSCFLKRDNQFPRVSPDHCIRKRQCLSSHLATAVSVPWREVSTSAKQQSAPVSLIKQAEKKFHLFAILRAVVCLCVPYVSEITNSSTYDGTASTAPRENEIITNTRMAFHTPLQYERISLTDKQAINVLWLSRLSWLVFQSSNKRTRRKCENTCCMCIVPSAFSPPYTKLTLLFEVRARTIQFFPDYSPRCLFQRAFSRSRLKFALKRRLQNCLWPACLASVTSWAWSNKQPCVREV